MNKLFSSLVFLALFLIGATGSIHASQPDDQLTMILPAPALQKSLRAMLPLSFQPNSPSFSGSLSIDRLDHLEIANNTLFVQGMLSGKNLAVTTAIAGQSLKIRLGRITTPVNCRLRLRFDPATHHIYVTPEFRQVHGANRNSQLLQPLFTALAGQEYQLDLAKFLSFNPVPDSNSEPISFTPVRVGTEGNRLTVGLVPVRKKSR